MFNSYQSDLVSHASGFDQKMKISALQNKNSLYSMALYDLESLTTQTQQTNTAPVQGQPSSAAFHPVDEYKDLSLKELLDLSDDFLFDDISPGTLAEPSHMHHPGAMLGGPLQHGFRPATVSPAASDFSQSHQAEAIASSSKRRRDISPSMDNDDEPSSKRFRPYQAGQWVEKFDELCEYREKMGHCLVPHTYSESLPLARWVKRQRYQYKLMREGKASTMTNERVLALENIGFVWDSQGAAWGERLGELKEFRQVYMHCNVPSNFSENPQLATWVKCQRRQYKLHMEGKPSNMTEDRIRHLENLGFEWELRTYKKAR